MSIARKKLCLTFVIGLACLSLAIGIWVYFNKNPKPTLLSLRIGEPYEEVVKNSTFPVEKHTVYYPSTPPDVDSTWISEPSVIIKFDDQKHGFILPPTTFAAITYYQHKVVNITTNPQLEALPFDQAVAIVDNLQKQFIKGGWVPQTPDDKWFDTSLAGRQKLHALISDYMKTYQFIVPNKYSMIFRLMCQTQCDGDLKDAKYLVDISIGKP